MKLKMKMKNMKKKKKKNGRLGEIYTSAKPPLNALFPSAVRPIKFFFSLNSTANLVFCDGNLLFPSLFFSLYQYEQV